MTFLRPMSVAALLVLAPAPVVAADGAQPAPPPPPQAGAGINGNPPSPMGEGANGNPPPLAAQGTGGGAGPPSPLATQPLDRLSATRDRPLFSPSRRPPAPPPVIAAAPEPPPPPPPPPNVALFGIVMDGGEARAVVRASPTDKIVRVRIGDDVGGWKVSQIAGRQLVLSLDDRTATIMMFTGKTANSAPHAGAEAPTPAPNAPSQPQNQIQQNAPAAPSARLSPHRPRAPR